MASTLINQCPVFFLAILTVLVQFVSGKNSKNDFIGNKQEMTYQDAFCFKQAQSRDPRYQIISFAIFQEYLLLFTPVTFFISNYGPPPFNVSHGLQYDDLNQQLSNLEYSTAQINSLLFTSVGIEVDDTHMLLLIGVVVCLPQPLNLLFFFKLNFLFKRESEHLVLPMFWNIKDQSKSPHLDLDVSAVINDNTNFFDLNQTASSTRFISGKGFFFVFTVDKHKNLTITRYDVKSNLKFQLTKYVMYQESGSYILEASNGYNENKSTNFYSFVRNGFIWSNTLYLANSLKVNLYYLQFIGERKIIIQEAGAYSTKDFIKCRLFDTDNIPFHYAVYYSIFCTILVLLLSCHYNSIKKPKGYKFVCGPNTILKELKPNFFYK